MSNVVPLRPLLDTERSVLSAALCSPEAFDDVRVLNPREDLSRQHGIILDAIVRLRAQSEPVDIVAVANELRRVGKLEQVGGTPYLAELIEEVPAVANVRAHVKALKHASMQRRLKAWGDRFAIEAAAADGAELAELLAAKRAEIDGFLRNNGHEGPVFDTASSTDIFAPLDALRYLLAPLDMCPGAPVLVAGYGFSGKTVALQSMAMSIAAGLPVWGAFEAAPGAVLHLDYEQGSRLTFERYQRIGWDLNVGPSDLQDNLRVTTMPGTYLDTADGLRALQNTAAGCRMVIVDSLRACAPSVDENSSEVRRVLDGLGRVSEATGATIVVIHHARKPQRDSVGGAKASIRGSGAIFDACGSVVVFEAAKGEPARVSHEKARASGVLKEDFELVIEDVPDVHDPRRGLRVSAQAAQPIVPPMDRATGPKGIDVLRPKIIELLRTTPVSSKGAIAEALGARRNTVWAAIDVLLAEGAIVEHISRGKRRFEAC